MSIRKSITRTLSIILIMIMAFGNASLAYAADNSYRRAKSDLREEALQKISKDVMEEMNEKDIVEVLVYLKDQVNTEKVAAETRKSISMQMTPYYRNIEVRRAVVEALKDKAETTQKNLLRYLAQEKEKGNVLEYRSYYIVNIVYVKATKDIVENIANMSEVKSIYKNRIHKLDDVKVEQSNDPELEWNIERIKADLVWDLGIDGAGVVVATIDSGVDWTHPALRDKWRGYNPETGESNPEGNWFDPVYNSVLPQDSDGHGTHVMGTILGQEPDGSNKIGVAPGAKWIAARVFDMNGYTSDSILLAAGEWILAPGGNPDKAPNVVNNSWGGLDGIDDWYRDTVRNWRAAGIFPVFSAGNQREGEPAPWPGSISCPANYPESFAVAATDINNKRASFSKLGPSPYDETLIKPEISAPGVSVRSSVPGNGYAYYSGTSMAAPAVSGVAALLLSANSSLTVDDIEEILTSTAMPLTDETYPESPNFGYGYGLVDAYEAALVATSGTGLITGRILKEGSDNENAVISHEQEVFEVYAGTNIDIIAEVSDDISVVEVELLVKQDDEDSWMVVPMKRISGDHRHGIYKGTITYDMLGDESIVYRIKAEDYSGYEVITEEYRINVIFGYIPDEYEYGFEDEPSGWKFNGCWEWGIPSEPGPEPYEGVNIAGTNLQGNYPDRADDWLITPPFDLRDSSLGSATLRFFEWYDTENKFDRGYVLVTNDYGVTWNEARAYITGEQRYWKEAVINLGDYIGSQNPVFVAFRFTSDISNNRAGWYIDNVRLIGVDTEPPAIPAGLSAEAHLMGIELNWEHVQDGDLSHYNVYRSILQDGEDGEYELISQVTENSYVDTEVEPGNVYYYKVAAVDFAGNISGFSNVVSVSPLSTSIIFGSDFEDDDGGFVSGVTAGSNNPWQWGIPTSGPNEAYSGEKLWATNLSGNYDSRTDAYIESPTIALPSDKDIVMKFNHWVDMEGTSPTSTKWDYGQVLVSNDDGTSWINITPTADGKYGTRIQKWQEEEIWLNDYKGQNIKIRFFFHSDASGNYPGWYIDDVYIIGIENPNENAEQITKLDASINEVSYEEVKHIYKFAELKHEKITTISDREVQQIPANGVIGIPLEDATITVLETGRSAKVNPATGEFTIRVPAGEYTVKAEAYGFYSEERRVSVSEDETVEEIFLLEQKPKGNISGEIYDRYDHSPVPNAVIRLIEDGNVQPVISDENGNFLIEDVYEGTYTLKITSDYFETGEVTVNVVGNDIVELHIPLKRFIGFKEEIAYDDGTAEDALILNQAGNGVAVRFTPSQYGKVKGVSIYFWNKSWPVPGGKEISIAIYEIDENGKAKIVGEPKIVNIERGTWNYIDLSEYNFATDRDFYISTVQTKVGALSPAVGIDESSEHGNRAFLNYNGEFRPLQDSGVSGTFMMRAYVENIAESPQITNLDEIAYTNEDRIHVEGKVTAEGLVHIYANGEKVLQVNSEGEVFAADIGLVDDVTVITATLELYGRETEPSMPITVIRDKVQPVLTVTKPINGEKINTEIVYVSGNVQDENFNTLLINGVEVQTDEYGNFTERLLVDSGENLIEIRAIDKAGNESIEEILVYANFSIPDLINIEPSEDILLNPGDILEVRFEAPTGGRGYFKLLLALGLESDGLRIPMREENGVYIGSWTVPDEIENEELVVEVIYISEYGTEVRKLAPGIVKIEPEGQPMENLPVNAVIVGNEAYDINYLNTNSDAQMKLINYYNEGSEIYIKLDEDLIVNMDGQIVGMEVLPDELIYYDAYGRTTRYVK